MPVVQEAARRKTRPEAADQLVGEVPLRRTDGVGVPLCSLEIVDGDKGRLSAHGQPDVFLFQNPVDILSEPVEVGPRLFGKRFGDTRMFCNPGDLHVEGEVDIGCACHSDDRRRIAVMWCRRQRNVALTCQEPRGRVEPDPACARKIDFRPGVQIGEVVVRAGWSIEGFQIGFSWIR